MERTEGRKVRHEYHDQIRHDCGSASRRVRVVLRGVVRPYCGDEPGLDSCRLRAGRPVRVAFWRQYGSNNFGFCPVIFNHLVNRSLLFRSVRAGGGSRVLIFTRHSGR